MSCPRPGRSSAARDPPHPGMPPVAIESEATVRSRVVLPQPLSPTRATDSPACTVRSTPLRIRTPDRLRNTPDAAALTSSASAFTISADGSGAGADAHASAAAVESRASISSLLMQASPRCPSIRSGGSVCSQAGVTNPQRGANAQPGGSSRGSGGSPASVGNRYRLSASTSSRLRSSAEVYGCRGPPAGVRWARSLRCGPRREPRCDRRFAMLRRDRG